MLRIRVQILICCLTALALGLIAPTVAAQSDPFGDLDLVYIDSVEVGAGEDVTVRFNVRNDEALSSLSIPVVYDTSVLTLKSISFTDSRAQHWGTKVIKPSAIDEIDGHFVVAMVQVFEDVLPVGDGMVFTGLFGVKESLEVGTVGRLDSLFYPPGGELILVEAANSTVIHPEFISGQVVVGEGNRSPIFTALPDQYALEGDSVDLIVSVDDPDEDVLSLAVTSKPSGSTFTDNGDGTARFVWRPDFVGPNSADGSPFTVSFWASDGDLSVGREIFINVINNNRAPAISAPESVVLEAGDYIEFELSAFDPDFEAITWAASGLPDNAVFDDGNPARVTWQSSLLDTGSFDMQFIAADPQGLSDTVNTAATVNLVALYTLALDSVQAFPGEDVEFEITLDNKFPVTSFNLLFNYDPSALSLLSLSNEGTRVEAFEYYNVQNNDNSVPGNVRVLAVADLGGNELSLAVGEGSIGVARFHTSGDLSFAGMRVPVGFRFLDDPVDEDNTFTDSIGDRIAQEDIVYVDGQVKIQDIGQIRIGDINLNGLAAEIGDVIYFSNYFINPSLYEFNALQYANSDVNQDNIAATVSDLVALINLVVKGGSASRAGSVEALEAEVTAETSGNEISFGYRAGLEIGGALVEFTTSRSAGDVAVTSAQDKMTLDYRQNGDRVTVLLYSLSGSVMPAGETAMFTVSGIDNFEIERLQMGSADGQHIVAALASEEDALPSTYTLEQNYPNPFNPETRIEFSLPKASPVSLTVFNVLGQVVNELANGELPRGVHTVVWDGTDGTGRSVASGVYFYRLETGGEQLTRKMMLLK